ELTAESSPTDVADAVMRAHPSCVVLMGNAALQVYRRYEQLAPSPKPIPAVVVMSSFLEEQITQLRNATGIAYEIPGVNTFARLRSMIDLPIRRVGVVYRTPLFHHVERQRELAAIEKVELVTVEVGVHPTVHEVRRSLYELLHKRDVDALWVLND